MSANHPPERQPLTLPHFESKLPPEFLHGLDERGRYLYTQLEAVSQSQSWMTSWAVAQDQKVEDIRLQTIKTNGGLTQAKADIVELKTAVAAEKEQIEPMVRSYKIASKLAKSRVFWAGLTVFILVILPWMTTLAPTPAVIARGLLSLLIGV